MMISSITLKISSSNVTFGRFPKGTPVFSERTAFNGKGTGDPGSASGNDALYSALTTSLLIATKANRIVRAANGRPIMEFGSRRAQGADAAVFGARAAYIAGCIGTACTIADIKYGIPSSGTMAHFVGSDVR